MRALTGFSTLLAAALLAAAPLPTRAAEPVIHVAMDETVNAARVHASIDIDAPPAIVWAVISDCARAPSVIPNLESCRILQHDAAGHWDIREHVINWALLMPKLRTVVRTSYEGNRRLMFKRVGGDMRVSEGEWRVEPLGNARATRLTYDALVAPSFPVPDFMIEHTVREDFPNVLRAIERVSLEDAARR